MLRVATGDGRAFSDLTRQLARPSLALAYRVLGDMALAEDALQEALTKLWKEADRFDPQKGKFTSWWRRILMNSALDGRRRLKPAKSMDELDNSLEVEDQKPTPYQQSENNDLAVHVQQAANGLPERQRAALALFHGECLSMGEIAETLNCSEKAVEGLLTRARATLKARLSALKDDLI